MRILKTGGMLIEEGDEIIDTAIAAAMLEVSQVRLRQYINQGAMTLQGQRTYLPAQGRAGVWWTTRRAVEEFGAAIGPRPRRRQKAKPTPEELKTGA
jgi:hypothetical protein